MPARACSIGTDVPASPSNGVRFAGRDWHCLFNFTCGRHELTWMKLDGVGDDTQAVFIGRNLDRHRDRITAELAACETDDEGKHDNV